MSFVETFYAFLETSLMLSGVHVYPIDKWALVKDGPNLAPVRRKPVVLEWYFFMGFEFKASHRN